MVRADHILLIKGEVSCGNWTLVKNGTALRSGFGTEWVQPVIQERVAPCKPCRRNRDHDEPEPFVHPDTIRQAELTGRQVPASELEPVPLVEDKPTWAIRGCGGHPRKQKIIVQPQLNKRPKKWDNKRRKNNGGFSCIHAECADYTKVYPTIQAVQQHARKHYPPEYSCRDCGGEWYLKTEYNYHFMIPCPHCDELFMKTSLSAHIKSQKCIN